MVFKPEPIFRAVESIKADTAGDLPIILLSPQGRLLRQEVVEELVKAPSPGQAASGHMVLICGRYEGVDNRVADALASDELSIGDYVLSGGEIPAMVLIDAVGRLVPGVVGDPDSLVQDTYGGELAGCPQFTRPAEYRGMRVPDVLLSGDHARIRQWRRQQAAQRQTRAANRP